MSDVVFNDKEELKEYLGDNYKEFINSPHCLNEDVIYEFLDDCFPLSKTNESENQEAYRQITELTDNEYLDNMISNETLKQEYSEYLEEYDTDDNLGITEDCVADVAGDITSETNFQNNFDNAVDKFMEKHERGYIGFGYENDGETKQLNEKESKNEVEDYSDLSEFDDEIGEQTAVNSSVELDYDTRDAAFIYIDGDVAEGDIGETHAQILEHYLKDMDREEDIPEDLKDDNVNASRPSQARMKRLLDTDNIAFGHIVDNMAFVEVLENGADENQVAKACKNEMDVDKVYFYDSNNSIVKRLAKNFIK